MAKKAKTDVPADESKGDKFKRLASKRVTKAVKAIDNVGNLFSKSYEFNAAQLNAISGYIKAAHDRVINRGDQVLKGGTVASKAPEIQI